MPVVLGTKNTQIRISHSLIAIISEKTIITVGTHLVLTWVGCVTRPAINPREARPVPKVTLVSSSIPTELGVGSYTLGPKIGVSTASRTI